MLEGVYGISASLSKATALCSIGTDTFWSTEAMISASRSVQRPSQRGRRTPLKNAEGLYSARLRARYRWKLSLPCSLMSRCEEQGKAAAAAEAAAAAAMGGQRAEGSDAWRWSPLVRRAGGTGRWAGRRAEADCRAEWRPQVQGGDWESALRYYDGGPW